MSDKKYSTSLTITGISEDQKRRVMDVEKQDIILQAARMNLATGENLNPSSGAIQEHLKECIRETSIHRTKGPWFDGHRVAR